MQYFESGDIRLAFAEFYPDIPSVGTIVLVHGLASNHIVNWVATLWTKTLTHAGFRVVVFDNRGHGSSEKFYDPGRYDTLAMAADIGRLMDHLDIERADVMGYSMGARISARFAIDSPERVRSLMLGGLGINLLKENLIPLSIAEAMEAESLAGLTDPVQRMFRAFAEQTKSDLKALAACIRGFRRTLSVSEIGSILCPTLVSVGTADTVAGSPYELATLIPGARVVDIPGKDHNMAVGDRTHKQGVLEFLAQRP